MSISAVTDDEDPESSVNIYYPLNFTSCQPTNHIITLQDTNITQLHLIVKKVSDKSNYSIIVRMEDVEPERVKVGREILAVVLLVTVVGLIICRIYNIKTKWQGTFFDY